MLNLSLLNRLARGLADCFTPEAAREAIQACKMSKSHVSTTSKKHNASMPRTAQPHYVIPLHHTVGL